MRQEDYGKAPKQDWPQLFEAQLGHGGATLAAMILPKAEDMLDTFVIEWEGILQVGSKRSEQPYSWGQSCFGAFP